MEPWMIWAAASLLYVAFYSWYIGFDKRLTADELAAFFGPLEASGELPQQMAAAKSFFAADDGKDFVMVNLLHLRSPLRESRKVLDDYQKPFLGALLRSGGHPLLVANAAVRNNVEVWGIDQAEGWHAAGLIRYRSRRALFNALRGSAFTDNHQHKIDALEKTFAFPTSPYVVFGGGPKVTVPLALALLAALLQLLFF